MSGNGKYIEPGARSLFSPAPHLLQELRGLSTLRKVDQAVAFESRGWGLTRGSVPPQAVLSLYNRRVRPL